MMMVVMMFHGYSSYFDCKITAIPETVKSPLMSILARSLHQILGLKILFDWR